MELVHHVVSCVHMGRYHRERRTRTVTRTDSEGNRRTEREEYWVTVTDFEYKLDLTEFIFPFGFIQSMDDQGQDVAALISAYLADDNMLKTLEMTVRKLAIMEFASPLHQHDSIFPCT